MSTVLKPLKKTEEGSWCQVGADCKKSLFISVRRTWDEPQTERKYSSSQEGFYLP